MDHQKQEPLALFTEDQLDEKQLGTLIQDGFYDKLIIIGYPFDLGARQSGFKVGQDYGPDSFRRFVIDIGAVINPEYDNFDISKGIPKISDYGNIQIDPKSPQKDLFDKLSTKVSACIKRQNIPFIVGGTRDLSYAVIRAACQQQKNTLHLLLRSSIDITKDQQASEIITQTNNLKYILDQPDFSKHNKVMIIGLQEDDQSSIAEIHQNIELITSNLIRSSAVIDDYSDMFQARTQAGQIIQNIIQKANNDSTIEQITISMSMECIQDIPGVSNRCSQGIWTEEAVEIAKIAAYSTNKLVSFDVSDYNPYIEDWNTGRLLSTMFYYFALGLSARIQQQK